MPIKTASNSDVANGIFYLEVFEGLTIHSISEEHKNIKAILGKINEIHFDFSRVSEIDTTGIQFLLSLQAWIKAEDKVMTMSLPSKEFMSVLDTYNLHSQFKFANA